MQTCKPCLHDSTQEWESVRFGGDPPILGGLNQAAGGVAQVGDVRRGPGRICASPCDLQLHVLAPRGRYDPPDLYGVALTGAGVKLFGPQLADTWPPVGAEPKIWVISALKLTEVEHAIRAVCSKSKMPVLRETGATVSLPE